MAVAAAHAARGSSSALVAALVATLFSADGRVAYGALAAAALLHAVGACAGQPHRRGRPDRCRPCWRVAAGGGALGSAQLTAAFVLSCLAIAMRAGVLPLHAGVASLCDRAPVVQTQQLASIIALVFVHLRFVDHHPGAIGPGADRSCATAPWRRSSARC